LRKFCEPRFTVFLEVFVNDRDPFLTAMIRGILFAVPPNNARKGWARSGGNVGWGGGNGSGFAFMLQPFGEWPSQ